jgi:hypothetical protein
MGLRRKEALKRLQGRVAEIEHHLARIAAQPAHSSVQKWKSEVRNWLREMEEVLPHAGKKTAAEWQARIDAYQSVLET